MPQPTLSAVHINRPLTNISLAFMQAENKYVADRVFPKVPVMKKSDTYFTFPEANWFRDEMKKRAPGTESAGGGYEQGTDQYSCDVWAYHKDIADQIRANTDNPLSPDRNATQFLTQIGAIRKEKAWAEAFFTTGIWTGSTTAGDITPGTKWDNAAGDPVQDVMTQLDAAEQRTSFRPNKMVVSPLVHTALKNNAEIKDQIKYTTGITAKTINETMLADLFGVDEYLVMRATHNTAIEGQTKAMSYIVGSDQAALYYAAPAPGLELPSAGYTFTWNGLLGANAFGTTISQFRMQHLKSDRTEIEMAFDQKQVAAECGVFFTDVLT